MPDRDDDLFRRADFHPGVRPSSFLGPTPGGARLPPLVTDERTADDDDPIRSVLERGTPEDVRMFLATLSPHEVADLLETVGDDLRERVFPLLDVNRQAKVLREVEGEEVREDLIE